MGFGEGLQGCYKCMKYILVAFNVLVLLLGTAVLGLGIWLLVDNQSGAQEMSDIWGTNLYNTGVYLLIAGGAVTIAISFFGCCGAVMESRCLLAIYFSVMLVLTIFFIAVAVVGFVFRDDITGALKEEAEKVLINDYGFESGVTESWEKLHKDLKCCGVYGDVKSSTSWAIFKLKSKWFNTTKTSSRGVQYVPDSCCTPDTDLNECVGRTNGDGKIPKVGPPVTPDLENSNPNLYTEGCLDKLEDFLEDNAGIILGISLAGLFIMLIGAIFAICLCVQIGKTGYVV